MNNEVKMSDKDIMELLKVLLFKKDLKRQGLDKEIKENAKLKK